MLRPAKIRVNPPVVIDWRGKKVSMKNALEGLRASQVVPDEEQDFLMLVRKKDPRLIKEGGGMGMGVGTMKAYLRVLKAEWGASIPQATKELRDQRIEICSNCEFCGPVSGCFGCSGIAKLLMNTPPVPEMKSKGCQKCGCYLEVKVCLSDEVLKADPREVDYPDHCWNRK